MELYGRGIVAGEGGRQNPSTGLEESMWRLGLGSDGSGNLLYPERPGEPDCAFYLRTGTCGYGERCRYNHPRDRGGAFPGAGRPGVAEYPERVGQPVCEYYMKTGTCKFGSTCKYHHPREGVGSVMPAMLNFYGYPLRPGEKECSYYMKTAQCKFGSSCKFHHPQLGDASVPSHAAPTYPVMQTSSVPSAHQIPPMASWQVGRPPMLPGSYMSSSYGPMLLSPGVVPVQGWSPYPAPISPLVSPGGQTVQPGPAYGLSHQMPPSVPAYAGSYVPVSSSARPSNSRQRDYMFPERPGQPECQFYMRTGDCRFGSTCKYHHPPDRNIPKSNCVLSPLGLPLRPGAQPCTYYAQNGVCKFGPTCKFDHPMSTLSYSPSASSLSDLPVAPHRFSIATMAPSSLSSEQRSEFFPVESFTARITSSENTSSSIGSIFSKGGFVPHPLIHPQVSTTSGSSSTRHGGEISSSI